MTRTWRRALLVPAFTLALVGLGSGMALACGGLVAPGHAEVLEKATTLVVWHGGLEHYVTGFGFAGSADRFGYIIPLPGVPTKIEKGGNWTLERLEREINPVLRAAFDAAGGATAPLASRVQVLKEVKIDALDIKIVRGGGADVAAWAKANGFDLTPDAPQVLGAYSSEGAVFAVARFDRKDAVRRGIIEGQGEVIHFTIPTPAPWIPLRILAMGKPPSELVDADLFVMTDRPATFGPAVWDMSGMKVRANDWAAAQLISDLRSDEGMSWLPTTPMWFTALSLQTSARNVHDDLSIDGGGPPLAPASSGRPIPLGIPWAWWLVGVALVGAVAIGSRQGSSTVRPA